MTPARLIDAYLRMRATLTGQSATGYQLERLRLNLPAGANPNSVEEQRAYFAHLAYAVERLNDAERVVVFLLRTPCGTKRYEREIRDGDLHIVERENPDGSRDRTQETYAGERYKCPGHAPGFVIVEGQRATFPTRLAVAERLGIGFSEVKRLVRTAYSKLEWQFTDDRENA